MQGNINEGFRLKWELIPKLDPYVRKLSTSVNTFKDKVDDLVVKYEEVTKELDLLKKCAFNQHTFTEVSLKALERRGGISVLPLQLNKSKKKKKKNGFGGIRSHRTDIPYKGQRERERDTPGRGIESHRRHFFLFLFLFF